MNIFSNFVLSHQKYIFRALVNQDQVTKKGPSCLNNALDFDEHSVLMTNLKYIQSTLQV